MQIHIEFTTEVLGTIPGKRDIASEYIVAKHPLGTAADELEAVPDVAEELRDATTFFPRSEGRPIMWDYMVRGHFKAACEALINAGQWSREALKKYRLTPYLYKKTIDQLVFVTPRAIVLQPPDGYEETKFVERPLRAQTMRGERIALARSESLPVGTTCDYTVECLNDSLDEWVARWLDYGVYSGYGQWRNGSFGRFTWQQR